MTDNSVYVNPLITRYASRQMAENFFWRTAAEVLDRDFFLRYDAAGKEYRGQNESDQN